MKNPMPTFPLDRLRHAAAVLLVAALLAAASNSRAEDIDIFSGVSNTNDLPNVLIIWDDSANWSASLPVGNCSYSDGTGGPKASNPNKEQGTKMAIEKCAIYNVVDALPTGPGGTALFNVALMLFNESPSSNNGGYPRKQFVPMTTANKTALKTIIAAITIGDDKGNNPSFTKTLWEAYLMFSKGVPFKGTAGVKWDPAAVAGGRYIGPPGLGCGKNHIIFMANGSPSNNENNDMQPILAAAGANVQQLVYPTTYINNTDQSNFADETTRFLRGVDVNDMDGVQNITTHAIAVTGSSSDGNYPNFIRAMAQQGGGQYYSASDVTSLTQYLINIFNAIQAANSVFASASLPVSVNAQGTYKNQVFIGVFRPDANALPRWYGNLKQYKFSYDPATNTLQLADVLGFPALNSSTGFFMPTAVSAWTTASTFWANDPRGTPPSISDLPDGPVVEKGGAAQRLRETFATAQATRKVLTCVGCASGTVLGAATQTQFVDANASITNAMLGAADTAERALLISWIRGADNRGDELGPGGTTTVRPSIHGDVLHSRPAVVDYGGTTGTVLFYGGNDGFIHAADGNMTGASGGEELWSFVPQEMFGRFKRLRENLPEIRFPSTPASAYATPRDYMVDGPVTIYEKLTSAGAIEQVLMYVSMRRGGRFLYAFDVTNPASPKFLWKRGSSDMSIGQTWSEPRVVRVKGNLNPVLILGGGYDPAAEDANPPATSTMGKAVFVLDAISGALVKTLPTTRSVPASVTLLDVDYDGYVDRAYAVDMGGTVYRIDFETAAGAGDTANWTIAAFANLGNNTTPRKFFYEPDVVQTAEFTAVMVGSGNREQPLLTTTGDRWYTLFDYSVAKGPTAAAAITDAQVVPYASYDPNAHPPGCYIAMSTAGEKVVTGSVSTGGNSYFATNMPTPVSSTSCASNLGLAKTYQVPLFCGTPNTQQLAGGGLPPTPVTGYVEVTYPNPNNPAETGTRTVPFIIGGPNPASSGIGASRVPIVVDPTRRRTYWYSNTNR